MTDFRALGRHIKQASTTSDVLNWMRTNPELTGAGAGALGGGIGSYLTDQDEDDSRSEGQRALINALKGAGMGAGGGLAFRGADAAITPDESGQSPAGQLYGNVSAELDRTLGGLHNTFMNR